MRIPTMPLISVSLLLMLVGITSAAPSFVLINCQSLFANGISSYSGPIGAVTSFLGIVNICIILMLVDFSILSVAYAIGSGFQIDTLTNFAKQEILEGVLNVAILVAIGLTAISVYPAMNFMVNIAQLGQPNAGALTGLTGQPIASSVDVYYALCSNIDTNIITSGFTNWLQLIVTLYIANFLQSINILVIPNSYGYAYQPFAGVALLVQLLWDDQTAFFGTMFFGMFMIVLLFVIYYLFPIFLYVGLALRSLPWTRAAGGSLIAMFIAFYIVFPALILPFVVLSTSNTSTVCGGTNAGSPLCHQQNFLSASISGIIDAMGNSFDLGQFYYTDVVGFVEGFWYIGINLFGLVVALLISYELVEKIGGLLGSSSISAQRALSRVL